MAQSDWTDCVDNLSAGALKFVASGAFVGPPGGGSFMGAWRSQTAAIGVHSKFKNGAGFAPTAKGGVVSAALRRGTGSGATGFAVFMFVNLSGTSNTDSAYILGLADGDPAHVVLRKGALVGGLPDVAPGNQGVLWRSTDVFDADEWVHLQLMVAVNLNGDAVISVWQNDLEAVGATVVTPSPGFVQMPGVNMLNVSGSGITDDDAGINTGSTSLKLGRIGFGMSVSDVGRVAFIDHIRVTAQS